MKEVTLLEAENMKLGNPSKEEEYILTLEEKKKTFIPMRISAMTTQAFRR